MVRRRNSIPLFLLLLGFWFLLTLNFEIPNIILGIALSLLIATISYPHLFSNGLFRYKTVKVHKLFLFFCILIFEIYKSSFIYIINMFKKDTQPFIIKIELSLSDLLQISIIANAISLTPGTVTIEINKNILTVLTYSKLSEVKKIEQNIKSKFEKYFLD